VFPFVKISKKAPDATASEIGTYLQENVPEIKGWNVVKGFLNLEIADAYWNNFLSGLLADADYGRQPRNGHRLMVEYSSPNTNKPLHMGHIRNILLGWSCTRIMDAVGYDIVK
ncbi:MAG: arginine--tRNA ligase, partial [Bacteroidota bacterium]